MRATEFEFRHRFYFIASIYYVGFACSAIDHRGVAAWLIHTFGWPDRPARHLLFGAATLLTVAAAALRTWAAAYLQSEVVHDTRLRSEKLVADGPYRHLRNPLYAGAWLLTLGVGLMASRLGFVVLACGITWFTLRLIGREEAVLAASQGSTFLDFKRAVPSVIPSLRPRVPAFGRPARWAQAFRGEAFMWVFAFAMLLYAVTLRARITFTLFFAALIGYVILNLRRAKQSTTA